MRTITPLSVQMILVFAFTIAQAQTAVPASVYAELEPITLENAARLVQLPGELTDVNNGFDVSPDGAQIAVARPDGVYLYDMGNFETLAAIFEIADADDLYGPQFSPDGNLLAINVIYRLSEGDDAENFRSITQLWNLEKGILAEELVLWLALRQPAVFSPDGRYLAGNSSLFQTTKNPHSDGGSLLSIWSLHEFLPAEPICCTELNFYGRYGIRDVEFSPDNLVVLWSIIEPDFANGYGINNYWRLEYLPSTISDSSNLGILTTLVSKNVDPNFLYYDEPFTVDINDIEFSRDGVWLATIGEYSKIWQIETVELKTTLAEGSKFAAFLPDNSMLSIDEDNGIVYVTNLDLSASVTIFDQFDALQQTPFLSSDGKLLAIHGNGTVHFYGVPAKTE